MGQVHWDTGDRLSVPLFQIQEWDVNLSPMSLRKKQGAFFLLLLCS